MSADRQALDEQVGCIVEAILDARDRGDTLSVADACAGRDPAIRLQVEAILAAYDRVDGLLRAPSPPAPVPTPPGFELLDELGRGGMGVVYQAREVSLRRLVAIKFMMPEMARDDTAARGRFLREARALAAVKHDHVVAIHQVGEVEGVPYLVMPLLEGQSLEEYLRAVPRPPLAEVLRIGREIASGLAAAHARELVHRDIKPRNVWLEASPRRQPGEQASPRRQPGECRVKLLDFGLARSTEDVPTASYAGSDATTTSSQTAYGRISGTPPYMSPEQMRGEVVDARSDLFSLGTVLYRMATGRLPFAGPDLAAVYKLVTEHRPPPARTLNPTVPAALSDLIEQLHAKEPSARPASATEVERRLGAIGMPPRRVSRRLVLAAGGLAVLGGGAWALSTFWPWRTPESTSALTKSRPLVLDLDVKIWKAGQRVGTGKGLWAPGVMPLRPGDAVRIEATADRPAYLYLLWFQADGSVVPGYPWQNDDWGQRPAHEEAIRELNIPAEANSGFELRNAASGIEAFVLLARDEPLPADFNLRGYLTGWRRQAAVPRDLADYGYLTDGRSDEEKPVSRGFTDAVVRVDNPTGVVCELTRRLYTERGLASRGVCFGYREK